LPLSGFRKSEVAGFRLEDQDGGKFAERQDRVELGLILYMQFANSIFSR